MLGRKSYTQEELDQGRSAVGEQLAAYEALVDRIGGDGESEVGDLERLFFNNMALALDRRYVYRLRLVAGKDGNPLNEVELICESLINNDGVLRGTGAIRYVPERSVVGLQVGDEIRLTADAFERLATAFFDELERRFV